MDFSLSEDHIALRDAAARFLDKEVDLSVLLASHERTVSDTDYNGLWAQMAELGWPGIVVPEAYGGLGMDYIDLVMIVGEMGRTLAPAPLFGTLAGAWAIERAGTEAARAALLADVAAGDLKLSLAVTDRAGAVGAGLIAGRDGEAWSLSGEKHYVVDALSADKIVILGDGGRYYLVDRDAGGVEVSLLDWRDVTREVCRVTLTNAKAVLIGEDKDAWSWIRDRLYLVLAAESAAGTELCLKDAVAYAKERIAFGRPIGAFQAIKHQLAEIAGISECATAGVQYAAWALSSGHSQASVAAAMAQSYASEAYRAASFRNIQVFGAIGFTWEMKNHLYYKRARANSELLGSPRRQREEVISMVEAGLTA